ncbi:pre-peptidase C-terminal domain-containing protein, partial [Pedobacter alpinus]
MRIYLILLLLLCLKLNSYAQPAGSSKLNPINVGTLNAGNSYTNTKNNATANGFGNNIGQASDDIFYKFTISIAAKVNLSHCASGFDTYMHLLDIDGNTVASNDDNGPVCAGLKSSISISLAAGTYFVVSEGYGTNSGNITTTINILLAGTDINNPFNIGLLTNSNSTFTDTRNNSTPNGYGNNYGQTSDDIFYKFSLNATAQINISHCSSGFDTYMHLLDASGNLITSNDDNGPLCAGLKSSISVSLAAGTYYIVSESYGTNSGAISTSISASFANSLTFDTYTEFIDYEMRFLDKSDITTGILYDRVNNLAGLNDFNVNNTDTSSNKHFKQSYFEMLGAAYNSSNWLTLADIKDLGLGKTITGQVPIGLSSYSFNMIDTNAVANNLFYMVDSVLYDTPNRTTSPYQLVNKFVAAPLLDSVPLSFSYYIGTEFLIEHSNKVISTIQIDFGDGVGLRTISLNSSIPVNYPTYGFKYLKFVIGFNDNNVITTYAMVKCADFNLTIPEPSETLQRVVQSVGSTQNTINCSIDTPSWITSKIAFQGYDETSASFGRGNVRTYYAINGACDGIIRKPIIIIDGFDPGDSRDIEKLYKEDLNETGFATNLRSQGYDIVILNFPTYKIGTRYIGGLFPRPIMRDGGADYIERNAMTLIALIDSINTVKQGTEKLTIIGPSMGGLISRYALNYMEQHSMQHKTKLWVSFDSPHKGANIPIGDQKYLEFFSTLSDAAKENLKDKIGSVAARQMLLHHYTDGTPNPQIPMPNGFRAQFLSSPYMASFPNGDSGQPFRKIALVDGSLGGNGVNTAGEKAFTFDTRHIKTRLFFIKVKIKTFTIASAKMYFTPSYGNTNNVLTAWRPFKSGVNSVIAPSNSSGYDTAPGGTYDTQEILQQEGTGIIGSESAHTIAGKILNVFTGGVFNVISTFYSVIPNHSFINTKSALAFIGLNQDLSENVSVRNLVCTGETPFNSYFGSFNENRKHVGLWQDAVNWVTEEINGNPQPPSVNDNSFQIQGSSQICNSSETYGIASLPTGATVNWTVNPSSGVVSSSISGNSITLTKTGNGQVNLSATIVTMCGNFNLPSRTINVGAPSLGMPSFTNSDNQSPYWCSNNSSGNSFTIET